MTLLRLLMTITACALACACTSDTRVGENDGSLGGTVAVGESATAPTSGNVYVIWQVSAGSPDYAYLYGEGTLSGDRFALELDAPPPDEAFNGDLAFGIVVLVDTATTVSPGLLDDTTASAMEAGMLGLATRHAVIYRRSTGVVYRPWEAAFPVGEYACGEAVDVGATFDDFEPIDCVDLQIRVDDRAVLEAELFNWT